MIWEKISEETKSKILNSLKKFSIEKAIRKSKRIFKIKRLFNVVG